MFVEPSVESIIMDFFFVSPLHASARKLSFRIATTSPVFRYRFPQISSEKSIQFFCYCTSDAGISILKCFCQWYAAVVPICKEMAALIQVWFYQINHYSSWLRELAAWCRCIQRLPSHVGKYIENVAI